MTAAVKGPPASNMPLWKSQYITQSLKEDLGYSNKPTLIRLCMNLHGNIGSRESATWVTYRDQNRNPTHEIPEIISRIITNAEFQEYATPASSSTLMSEIVAASSKAVPGKSIFLAWVFEKTCSHVSCVCLDCGNPWSGKCGGITVTRIIPATIPPGTL